MAKQKTGAKRARKAQGSASKIRHGGKAGKDKTTKVLERAFGSFFGNRVAMVIVILLLVGGGIGFTLMHKVNSEKIVAAADAWEALKRPRPPGEKPATVKDVKEWLEKYEGESDELDVRTFLITTYENLGRDNDDPEMFNLALREIQMLREDFGDEPLVAKDVDLPGEPRNWLRALEERIVAGKNALPGFNDNFRKPGAD